jgi:hypothetical protein
VGRQLPNVSILEAKILNNLSDMVWFCRMQYLTKLGFAGCNIWPNWVLQDAIFDQHGLLQPNNCSLQLMFFFLSPCFYQGKKIEQEVCFRNLTMCLLPSYHFLCWFFKTDNVLIFPFSSFLLRQSTKFVLKKMTM